MTFEARQSVCMTLLGSKSAAPRPLSHRVMQDRAASAQPQPPEINRDWEPERKRCGAEDSTNKSMGRKKRPEHVEVRIVRMHGKKVKEKRVVEIVSNGAADLVNEIEAALNDLKHEPTQTEE